jgi:hypothetical protein
MPHCAVARRDEARSWSRARVYRLRASAVCGHRDEHAWRIARPRLFGDHERSAMRRMGDIMATGTRWCCSPQSAIRPWRQDVRACQVGAVTSRLDWTGIGPFLVTSIVAVALTAWQVQVDRSVFESYFGALDPIGVMTGVAVVGVIAMAYLQGASDFAVLGPGAWRDVVSIIAWVVPLLAAAAIGSDLVFRYAEDTNVAMPDALRFYPAIAVFVEIALHVVPIAVLVAVLGMPTGFDATFWRIAVPVALIEAVLQAVYATSTSTSVFNAVHLMVFGVVEVWIFWRFGFTWMLGFRLVYYILWHVAWGVARLELLF